jgi:hypothetical protein
LDRKIITVNYAQALKRDGKLDQAKKILNEVDWSAVANDFKLARTVLLEEYDHAAVLMRSIGEKGQLLKEEAYHTWPLFIEFRETEQFAQAYQEVFGHPYAEKLREDANEASKVAAAQAAMELSDVPTANEIASLIPDILSSATDRVCLSGVDTATPN